MITIIDLGISNIKSITRGFITQGFDVVVTKKPEEVLKADSLVLPGVGAFPRAMDILNSCGLDGAIIEHVKKGNPLLGVCLGMQLLFTESEEHGITSGLNIIKGKVVRFPDDRPVPHMGWNEVVQVRECPIFKGIPDRADFYFVHSYHCVVENPKNEVAYSDHYGKFTAAVQKGLVFGTQFHPEKSQNNGLKLLRNYARLTEKGE